VLLHGLSTTELNERIATVVQRGEVVEVGTAASGGPAQKSTADVRWTVRVALQMKVHVLSIKAANLRYLFDGN